MLLRQLYEERHCNLVDGPLTWQEAMHECIKPLVADGSVTQEYAECLVENIEKHGPYIVLVPGLAMPHALANARGTLRSAISFMRVKEPVHFGDPDEPETDAQVFFTLSDVDPDEHLKQMQKLMVVMTNDDAMERLKNMESLEELLEIDALVADDG